MKLAGTFGLKNSVPVTAKVLSVDEDNRVCTVETILSKGTVTLSNVNLSAEKNDGLIQIPAIDSTVIVLKMPDGQNYVIGFSDIDKLVCFIDGENNFEFDSSGFIWNGGLLGGMAKTQVLAAKLNVLETQENAFKIAVAAMLLAAGASPGTPVTNAALAAYFTTYNVTAIIPTTQSEIEDNKIKH